MAVMIILNQPNQFGQNKRSQVFPWIAGFSDGSRLELCKGIKPLQKHTLPCFLLETKDRMPNVPDRFKPHVDESLSKGTDTWTYLWWSLVLVKWISLVISCHQHTSLSLPHPAPLWTLGYHYSLTVRSLVVAGMAMTQAHFLFTYLVHICPRSFL